MHKEQFAHWWRVVQELWWQFISYPGLLNLNPDYVYVGTCTYGVHLRIALWQNYSNSADVWDVIVVVIYIVAIYISLILYQKQLSMCRQPIMKFKHPKMSGEMCVCGMFS